MLCMPSPITTSITSARLLNTTTSMVLRVSVTRTVIFSVCIGSLRVLCGSSLRPDRGFRAERLYDCFVRLDIRPADQVDAIGHGGEDAVDDGLAALVLDAFQSFPDRLRLAGQVEDQRFSTDHAHLPRENRGRHELEADLAHLLAEAGHDFVRHRERRFRRDVARRRPGAAGGEHQVAAFTVHQLLERPLDGGPLVGYQPLDHPDRGGGDGFPEPFLQSRYAFVLVDALREIGRASW